MTTAVTDLINALILFPIALSLRHKSPQWFRFYVTMSLVCLLGFIVHAFHWKHTGWVVCWALLYPIVLDALNTFLRIGWNTYSETSHRQAFWLRLIATAVYLLFLILLLAGINPIRFFVLYCAAVAVPALYFYAKLALRGHRGSRILYLAFIPQIPGLAIQLARKLEFTFLWDFDYNSIYHILLLVSLIIVYFAARIWNE